MKGLIYSEEKVREIREDTPIDIRTHACVCTKTGIKSKATNRVQYRIHYWQRG